MSELLDDHPIVFSVIIAIVIFIGIGLLAWVIETHCGKLDYYEYTTFSGKEGQASFCGTSRTGTYCLADGTQIWGIESWHKVWKEDE